MVAASAGHIAAVSLVPLMSAFALRLRWRPTLQRSTEGIWSKISTRHDGVCKNGAILYTTGSPTRSPSVSNFPRHQTEYFCAKGERNLRTCLVFLWSLLCLWDLLEWSVSVSFESSGASWRRLWCFLSRSLSLLDDFFLLSGMWLSVTSALSSSAASSRDSSLSLLCLSFPLRSFSFLRSLALSRSFSSLCLRSYSFSLSFSAVIYSSKISRHKFSSLIELFKSKIPQKESVRIKRKS